MRTKVLLIILDFYEYFILIYLQTTSKKFENWGHLSVIGKIKKKYKQLAFCYCFVLLLISHFIPLYLAQSSTIHSSTIRNPITRRTTKRRHVPSSRKYIGWDEQSILVLYFDRQWFPSIPEPISKLFYKYCLILEKYQFLVQSSFANFSTTSYLIFLTLHLFKETPVYSLLYI